MSSPLFIIIINYVPTRLIGFSVLLLLIIIIIYLLLLLTGGLSPPKPERVGP